LGRLAFRDFLEHVLLPWWNPQNAQGGATAKPV
jgi:hypothetical protein